MHHSTREASPSLDTFYATVLGDLSGVRTVLDLGWAQPLALPWMGLPATTTYLACDVDHAQMALACWWLDFFSSRAKPLSATFRRRFTHRRPGRRHCFLLKIVPYLEQQDRRLAERLLDQLQRPRARHLLPGAGLGGRRKGMVDTYARRMDNYFGRSAMACRSF